MSHEIVQRLVRHIEDSGGGGVQCRDDLKSEYTMRMIAGHVPDVSATLDGALHLYAVVSDETAGDGQAGERWKAFADFAQRGTAVMHVVVPAGERQLLDRLPDEVKAIADVLEV